MKTKISLIFILSFLWLHHAAAFQQKAGYAVPKAYTLLTSTIKTKAYNKTSHIQAFIERKLNTVIFRNCLNAMHDAVRIFGDHIHLEAVTMQNVVKRRTLIEQVSISCILLFIDIIEQSACFFATMMKQVLVPPPETKKRNISLFVASYKL